MSEILDDVADSMAERLWTRIRADDRLDALDEGATGPTHRERLAADRASLQALVSAGLGDLFRALADPDHRETLSALRDDSSRTPPAPLTTGGLVISSWDGTSFRVSELGSAALGLFEAVASDVEARLRARLGMGDGR